MEMILNEYDMVVGAEFDNGTIQDYVDDKNTFGLVRIDGTTANWFLFNDLDSDDDTKKLYNEVVKKGHHIHDEFGEKIVVFNKTGQVPFEDFISRINEYIDDGMGDFL